MDPRSFQAGVREAKSTRLCKAASGLNRVVLERGVGKNSYHGRVGRLRHVG